jgi:hemerythrin
MSVASWDDSYRTGNQKVDEQHKALFGMVNELHEAILANKSKEILAPTLEKLAKYTIEHFQTEETMMQQMAYPGLHGHKKKHEDLTSQVKQLVDGFRGGKMTLSITLSQFLANWLRHHIKEDDVTLIRFVREKTAAAAAK